MNIDLIAGFIVGFCLVQGISIFKKNKALSIVELSLNIVNPIFLKCFLAKKSDFVFGGTDYEFLLQTALVDQNPIAWLIIILYVTLIAIAIYNLVKYSK